MRKLASALMAGAAISLSGCAYGLHSGPGSYGGVSVGVGYGDGYGYGYSPYGYGQSPYGYGYGSGYGGYGSYGGYGGYPYYGWYGDRYYPGTGYYVYDRYRRPYVWNDRERNFWTKIRESIGVDRTRDRDVRADSTRQRSSAARAERRRPALRPNWEGFDRRPREERRQRANEERRDRR